MSIGHCFSLRAEHRCVSIQVRAGAAALGRRASAPHARAPSFGTGSLPQALPVHRLDPVVRASTRRPHHGRAACQSTAIHRTPPLVSAGAAAPGGQHAGQPRGAARGRTGRAAGASARARARISRRRYRGGPRLSRGSKPRPSGGPPYPPPPRPRVPGPPGPGPPAPRSVRYSPPRSSHFIPTLPQRERTHVTPRRRDTRSSP